MLGKIKYTLKKQMNAKNSYMIVIAIFSLFIMVGGFSFALFTSRSESRGALNIVTGNLYPYIESSNLDSTQSLTVNSKEEKEITITLKNVNTVTAKYNLWYEAAEGISISYDSTGDRPPVATGDNIEADSIKTYKLKIINNTESSQKVTFGSDVGLSNKKLELPAGKKAIESVIVRTKMTENMIKVVYDETQKTWIKADSSNWYNYDQGKWANAVTVSSTTRETYSNASVGTPVNMDDIETMWVWIPRYSYTIGSEDGEHYYGKQGTYLDTAPTKELPGEIDIKFIGKTEKDTGSAQYKVTEGVSNWRTPDAFTFGEEELSGIWVGKFETSSSDPTAENGGGNTTDLDPMIKPNVTSWRGVQVATIGEVGRKVSATNNRYGFDNTIDSHAMKNDEWAAAAYLSQSKYGKLGNRDFSGMEKEIYQNKSDQYITGCSYGSPSNGNTDYGCQYTYDISVNGTGASTTGTIYGVYDMSGGVWEYVMGNYAPNGEKYSGPTAIFNSGYTGILEDGSTFTGKNWLNDKYYNFYIKSDTNMICSNEEECKSHGLSEVAEWYGDYASVIYPKYPWYVRGGYRESDKGAGSFAFGITGGEANSIYTFRLVLTSN